MSRPRSESAPSARASRGGRGRGVEAQWSDRAPDDGRGFISQIPFISWSSAQNHCGFRDAPQLTPHPAYIGLVPSGP